MIVNPEASVRLEKILDGFSVLIIDDVYSDVDDVRREALAADYSDTRAFYPGRHARIECRGLDEAKLQLCQIISAVAGSEFLPSHVATDFSIITTPANQLLTLQKHPHVDPTLVAGIVYLTPTSNTGTCFFRNRSIDRYILRTADDVALYKTFSATLKSDTSLDGYQVNEHEIWEKIYTVESGYNRFVAYPGNVFHSVDIADVDPRPGVEYSRLTQRLFFGQPN